MQQGVVQRLVSGRGFGFLRSDAGIEYFFHAKELQNAEFAEVQSGMRVSFNVEKTDKGLRANTVSVIA